MTHDSKQFDAQVGRHAQDYGLNPSDPGSRQFVRDEIARSRAHYDEVRTGPWNPNSGGGSDYSFFRQGDDVVVTKSDESFVNDPGGWCEHRLVRGSGALVTGAERTAAQLLDTTGKELCLLRRLWYVSETGTDTGTGPIELMFRDASVLFLDGGPDGEQLRVLESSWQDPFAEPLTAENQEYVRESGKWTAFDVSEASPYNCLIGKCVTRVVPRFSDRQHVTGVTLEFGQAILRAEVEADDLYVTVDRPTAGRTRRSRGGGDQSPY